MKKKISGHIHLYAEFQINKRTRELDQIINPGNEMAGQAKGLNVHKNINYILPLYIAGSGWL